MDSDNSWAHPGNRSSSMKTDSPQASRLDGAMLFLRPASCGNSFTARTIRQCITHSCPRMEYSFRCMMLCVWIISVDLTRLFNPGKAVNTAEFGHWEKAPGYQLFKAIKAKMLSIIARIWSSDAFV